MKSLLLVIAGLVNIVSCSGPDDGPGESGVMHIAAVPEDCRSGARSVLSETPEYENMVTGITMAVFDEKTERLVECVYAMSGTLSVTLPKDRTYRIYLLANMGNLTSRIPLDMNGMASFRYDVLSYAKMKNFGLPMACSVSSAWKPELTLNLRRLMAKLMITVDKSDFAYMGGGGDGAFRNNRIAVNRVARALYPFASGGSAAKNINDLFLADDLEYESFSNETFPDVEEITLYVPENMQGVKLAGNTAPGDKSESNYDLEGAELCTYVSLDGYKDGSVDGVYGSFVYKFFPGADNVTNFDLVGGKRYNVTLRLTWNGMYVDGGWKVEKTDWSDNRRMFVSLEPDGGYVAGADVVLARGSSEVPVYVYYTPQGYEYDSDAAVSNHHGQGWMFYPVKSPDGAGVPPYPKESIGDFTGSRMSTGFVEHQGCRTMHYVSVAPETEAGYSNTVRYLTWDYRVSASLKINVVEPSISFSPSSMLFLFHECGHDFRRTVRISASSPVKPCNIEVYADNPSLVTVGAFNQDTGAFDVYWNETNTGSSPKTAKVYLHSESCGVTAECTLVQQNRPSLSIDGSEEGGSGDVEY